MMKLESGDYLEVTFKDFIRQNIPGYEKIWGQYIGHDGKGRMIDILSLSGKEHIKRVKFSEHFYTCLESFICMNEIASKTLTVDFKNPKQYLDMLNDFMAYQAHAGRIHDNTRAFLSLIIPQGRLTEVMSRMEDAYQQRNNVLHGKKLPYRIEDSLVLIVPVKGAEESDKYWHSDKSWSDVSDSDLVDLKDNLIETLNEILVIFNGILEGIIKDINVLVENNKIILPEPNISDGAISISGSIDAFIPGEGRSGFAGPQSIQPYNIGKSGFTISIQEEKGN